MPAPAGEDEIDSLRAELAQLRMAVKTHELVGQAVGILVERHGWRPDEGLRWLRAVSQRSNVKVTRLAEELVADALSTPRGKPGRHRAVPGAPIAGPAGRRVTPGP